MVMNVAPISGQKPRNLLCHFVASVSSVSSLLPSNWPGATSSLQLACHGAARKQGDGHSFSRKVEPPRPVPSGLANSTGCIMSPSPSLRSWAIARCFGHTVNVNAWLAANLHMAGSSGGS